MSINLPRCLDCGKELKHYRSKRCRSCSRKIPLDIRFWSKVNKDGPIVSYVGTPCWIWIGRCLKGKHKYGYFDLCKIDNRNIQIYAHRLSWEISNNQTIPAGLYVLHRCDNPSCVNPSHLFLGTYKDNSDDMTRKGRAVHVRGEKHGCAKLTQIQVDEIRRSCDTPVQLAEKYGVIPDTIHRIIKYKSWK
jgi:hypothetical protein